MKMFINKIATSGIHFPLAKSTVAACAMMLLGSSAAFADGKAVLQGSDTLGDVMKEAIASAGLTNVFDYQGGGSGAGETAFVSGAQNLVAMSRVLKPEALEALKSKNAGALEHVIGLDGVSLFANQANAINGLTLGSVRDIFSCKVTRWEDVTGSRETGAIHVFRRDDKSGTTDTLKSLTGLTAFGPCAVVVNSPDEIADQTVRDPLAIGYAGLGAKREGNVALPIGRDDGSAFVAPNATTIRAFTYPLARRLYVDEVTGARGPNANEAALLGKITDRKFMDPLIVKHDFITVD